MLKPAQVLLRPLTKWCKIPGMGRRPMHSSDFNDDRPGVSLHIEAAAVRSTPEVDPDIRIQQRLRAACNAEPPGRRGPQSQIISHRTPRHHIGTGQTQAAQVISSSARLWACSKESHPTSPVTPLLRPAMYSRGFRRSTQAAVLGDVPYSAFVIRSGGLCRIHLSALRL